MPMTQQDAEEIYGKDATEWLRRWDEGRGVWTIEMGGMGPGYEQAIQITVAEILRHLLDKKYDPATWGDKEQWIKDRDSIEQYGFSNPVIKEIGLSGAQWGAAMNLAAMLYRNGPAGVMQDERVKDRHIQASRDWPKAA